jgi:hypothetical protein
MIRYGCIRRGAATATLISFCTACYSERPLTAPAPAQASRIIAQVTDTGAVTMANVIGPAALSVEGVVAEADAGTWKLHLLRVEQRGGMSSRWNRELVTFPRYALTNAREKRLDKRRSWIVAVALTAAIVAGTLLFGSALGGDDGPGGEPVPPA